MGLFSRIKNWISERIPQPQPVPAPDRPRRSWRDWLPWNRRKKEEPKELQQAPPEPKPSEPVPAPQEPQMSADDWNNLLDVDYIGKPEKAAKKPKPQPAPEPETTDSIEWNPSRPEITTLTDEELIDKYSDMLNKMIKQGYIDEFRNDKEKAEFLRVLSSNAWNEAHTYFYSIVAFQEIQDAIQRGATARALQEQYNMEKEKKSNAFLQLWDTWAYYDR